jgi:hypothetical protein
MCRFIHIDFYMTVHRFPAVKTTASTSTKCVSCYEASGTSKICVVFYLNRRDFNFYFNIGILINRYIIYKIDDAIYKNKICFVNLLNSLH